MTRPPYRSVALTGHRRQALTPDQRVWVARTLRDVVAPGFAARYGTTEAISGMALGADTWWAQAALSAGLDLAAYIPSPDQAGRWKAQDRALWHDLRSQATREVVLGPRYQARSVAIHEAFHVHQGYCYGDIRNAVVPGTPDQPWEYEADVATVLFCQDRGL